MPVPTPRSRTLADLKTTILRPALTSHYECLFQPPSGAQTWISQKSGAGLGRPYNTINQELLRLSCSEATLPGSSLITHEINNDFTGVTERHVYRRQYDDRADFTFYVDHDYNIIHFFENWISYTCNQQLSNNRTFASGGRPGLDERSHNYRVNFPNDYKTDELYITKFEKDYSGRNIQYQFINAFPISINSMPVSYDQSDLLKCTVSFTYSRYLISSELVFTEEDLRRAVIIGGSGTDTFEDQYQLQSVPGQFRLPPGSRGAADALGGLGGISVRNPVVERP